MGIWREESIARQCHHFDTYRRLCGFDGFELNTLSSACDKQT